MKLLGDVGHVESPIFSLEIVLVSVQDRCMVCAKRIIGSEIILDAPDGTTRLQGSSGNSFSVSLEIVLILTQDSCMVCVERAIGSQIVRTHPMELLGDVGHVESHFGPFGDNISVVLG